MEVAFVLASGPSLTIEDVEAIRATGKFTIAVNSTIGLAPWANVLYAGDYGWWRYNRELWQNYHGIRYMCSKSAARDFDGVFRDRKVKPGYNSGANAVEVAANVFKKDVVIMLGFDCSLKNGIHHHGKHERSGNPTEARVEKWQAQFSSLPKVCKKTRIINCSRYTEIDCIDRMSLEEAKMEFRLT